MSRNVTKTLVAPHVIWGGPNRGYFIRQRYSADPLVGFQVLAGPYTTQAEAQRQLELLVTESGCDRCNHVGSLFHNERTGLALCESCDMDETDDDETETEPTYWVAYGIHGYGPELDYDQEPIALSQLDEYLSDELGACADQADEYAHALGEAGDFEAAWAQHVLSDDLTTLSMNFAPSRKNAPLYAGNLPLWHETLTTLVRETFPIDVSPSTALYVWESEGGDEGDA